MTKRQRVYYLEMARRAWAASGSDRPFDEWRHAEVEAALGAPVRFRDFSNRDLDRVLARFRSWLDRSDPTDETDPALAGDRRRLLHVVRWLVAALPRRYAARILRERFDLVFDEELETRDTETLNQIRMTLAARARRRGVEREEENDTTT